MAWYLTVSRDGCIICSDVYNAIRKYKHDRYVLYVCRRYVDRWSNNLGQRKHKREMAQTIEQQSEREGIL